jgi:hypothetical protein
MGAACAFPAPAKILILRKFTAEAAMHRVRVVRSYYDQSEPFIGRTGEVIGHWGADNNEDGRDGFMVQFEDGTVIGVSENEVEDVADDDVTGEVGAVDAEPQV